MDNKIVRLRNDLYKYVLAKLLPVRNFFMKIHNKKNHYNMRSRLKGFKSHIYGEVFWAELSLI